MRSSPWGLLSGLIHGECFPLPGVQVCEAFSRPTRGCAWWPKPELYNPVQIQPIYWRRPNNCVNKLQVEKEMTWGRREGQRPFHCSMMRNKWRKTSLNWFEKKMWEVVPIATKTYFTGSICCSPWNCLLQDVTAFLLKKVSINFSVYGSFARHTGLSTTWLLSVHGS